MFASALRMATWSGVSPKAFATLKSGSYSATILRSEMFPDYTIRCIEVFLLWSSTSMCNSSGSYVNRHFTSCVWPLIIAW